MEAKFSFSLIASAVLHGFDTGRLDVFTDSLCLDAEVCELADKVEVIANERISETATKIKIKQFNLEIIDGYADILTPFSQKTREDLVRKKAAKLLGDDYAELIWNMVNHNYLKVSIFTKALMCAHVK